MADTKRTAATVRAAKEPKDNKKLPKGAKIVSKDTTVTVKEIENGYITCTRTEYRYTMPNAADKYPDYLTVTREYYTEEDPLEIKIADKLPELADIFESSDDDTTS